MMQNVLKFSIIGVACQKFLARIVGSIVPHTSMTWDSLLLATAIALLPLFHLILKNWTESWLVILAALGMYGIWRSRLQFKQIFPTRSVIWIFTSLSLPLVAVFISILLRGDIKLELWEQNVDLLNGPSRLFLAGVAFLWMNYKKVRFLDAFQIICSISIMLTIFFATRPDPGAPHRPTSGIVDVDTFSQQICLLGLLQVLFLLFRPSASRVVFALSIISILLAAKMGVVSGGRGGWIVIPPILLIAAFLYKGNKLKLLAVAIFIFFGFVLTLATNKFFYERLTSIYTSTAAWFGGSNCPSSGGAGRLSMWTISWELIKQKPITGYASKNNLWGPVYQMDPSLYLRKGIVYEDEAVVRNTLCQTGEHNEYLHEFLNNGIFGFLAKLLLLLIPLGVFIIKLKNSGPDDYALSVIGICFVVAFMIFGITQGPFAYKFICSFYGFVIAGLNAQIFSNQDERNSLGSPASANEKRNLAA